MRLFIQHPLLAAVLVYIIGLFQGVFVGVVYAVREKRDAPAAVPP